VTYKVQTTSNLSAGWTTIQTFPIGGSLPETVTVQDTQAVNPAVECASRDGVNASKLRLGHHWFYIFHALYYEGFREFCGVFLRSLAQGGSERQNGST
jgi:hypothetical protein